jgi:hypothetical protein
MVQELDYEEEEHVDYVLSHLPSVVASTAKMTTLMIGSVHTDRQGKKILSEHFNLQACVRNMVVRSGCWST